MVSMRCWLFLALGLAPGLSGLRGAEKSAPVSFRHDVMPVLVQAGCSMGACHGSLNGRGDLSLSLRGEDPEKDHATLVKSFLDEENPRNSLLLTKPTLETPHEGGKRFERGSEEYDILSRWVAAGAKFDAPEAPRLARLEVTPREEVLFGSQADVRISVKAHFTDGEEREVTRWSVFTPSNLLVEVDRDGRVKKLRDGETTVVARYLEKQVPVSLAFVADSPGYRWEGPDEANFIDREVFAKQRRLHLPVAPRCDDHTYARRVHLDLVGRIPTAAEARAFIADRQPDKRARLVESLLGRMEFADFWALKWADLLRLEEKVLDTTGTRAFHTWIRDGIAQGKPLDLFAREILTAQGSTYQVAPANYYRALRAPDARAEAVAQVFLGARMNCARCHNHPFEKWTMDDYYGFAAVFDGVGYDIKENKREDENDKNRFRGEQIVLTNAKRELKDPRTGKEPAPRLLDGRELPFDGRLEALAHWLTADENGAFPRIQANRIWSQLMGRGLVDPVDDIRATNPPTHPALLEGLTKELVSSGYDLRHMIRLICASSTYQLAGQVPSGEGSDFNYTHIAARRLSAEQILDSLHGSLGGAGKFNGHDQQMRASALPGVRAVYNDKSPAPCDRFLTLFGKPERLMNTETEREGDSSLAQIFELTSGRVLDGALRSDHGLLARLAKWESAEAAVDELWWTVLGREPASVEREAALSHLRAREGRERRAAWEDLGWALINAKEFLLRY